MLNTDIENESLKKAKIREELKRNFPNVWVKEGWLFKFENKAIAWSGKESIMPDGAPAFDSSGVHKELITFANKHDAYWENHGDQAFLLYFR